MKKYFHLAKVTLQEYLVYRLNFLLWRFRRLVVILTLLFFWLAIYGTRNELLGYQRAQMLTYAIGVAFLRSVILASRTGDLVGQIRSGDLAKNLLRPWNIFKFYFTKDLVDKGLNLGFALVEISLVFYFLKLSFYSPQSVFNYFLFFLICLFSMFLYFLISFWLSLLSFWVDQPWAPRWLFGIIFLEFLSGGFFPLDVLPPAVVKVASFTPFPYLIYFPLKIWLEQVDSVQIIKVLLVSLFWVVLFWLIVKRTWDKGLKGYAAYGG